MHTFISLLPVSRSQQSRLHTVCNILHSMRAYFTVTKYVLTTSELVLGFLTSLFKSEIFSEILTYREIFTRNEFSCEEKFYGI